MVRISSTFAVAAVAVTALLRIAVVMAGDGGLGVPIKSQAEFDALVGGDDRVWVVEYSSAMCGSCAEFKPTWQQFVSASKKVQTAHVNIDEAAGQDLAAAHGVLDIGVPNVMVYAKDANEGVSVASDPEMNFQQLAKAVSMSLKSSGAEQRGDVWYRSSSAEL